MLLNQNHRMNKTHRMNQVHSSEYLFNESNSKRKEVISYDSCSFDKGSFIELMQNNKMKRIHKMKDLNQMNKAELLSEVQRLSEDSDNKDLQIIELTSRLEASSKDGRKSQVLELLREFSSISILSISQKLGISTKNVSSQLTYLRSDGYAIFTDPNGKKCLFEDKTNIIHSVNEDDSITDDDMENLVDSIPEDDSSN